MNPMLHQKMNQSDSAMAPDRPDQMIPIMESVKGNNIPYRGINEEHGVEFTQVIDVDADQDWLDDPGEFIEPEFEDPYKGKPVEVVVVQTVDGPLIDWRSERFQVSDRAIRVAGKQLSRVKLQLRNDDAANVIFLGPNESVSAQFNGQIAAGKELELDSSKGDVWAVCGTGLTAYLSIFEEFAVEDRS